MIRNRLSMRRLLDLAQLILLPIAILAWLYLSAGLIGGSRVVNRDWAPAKQGVRIWLTDNGIHTSIVVPVAQAGVDWRDLVRPEHVRDPRYGGYRHLAFGWGDRDFYVHTPRWRDLRPATVIRAATGSDHTVMHVSWEPVPQLGRDTKTLLLSQEEYRKLASFIRASFAPDAGHQHGYYGNDAFYDAVGRYSAIRTCNAWTGEALASARVKIGRWTPFPITVMQWH